MTRHDLDLFSLFSGLVLTGIALVALFGVSIDIAGWVWPTVLIGVGLVVLASVIGSSRSDGGAATDDTDEPTSPEHDAALTEAREEVEAADRTVD